MFENLIVSLQQFGDFSQEQLAAILPRLTILNFAKDEMLMKEGQICRAFYFVNAGGFKHYTILDSGEESIINLFIRNEWILEYKSFITQQPSENIIQSVTNSEVFVLSVHDFHELVKMSDCFFRLGGILQQAIQNQDYQHNRLSPEQKYEQLLATKPELLQVFSLKQIASYLGIAPETLSRVRKKIAS